MLQSVLDSDFNFEMGELVILLSIFSLESCVWNLWMLNKFNNPFLHMEKTNHEIILLLFSLLAIFSAFIEESFSICLKARISY